MAACKSLVLNDTCRSVQNRQVAYWGQQAVPAGQKVFLRGRFEVSQICDTERAFYNSICSKLSVDLLTVRSPVLGVLG